MKTNLTYNFLIIMLLCILWIVLLEEISLFSIATGIFLGSISLYLTNRLVPHSYYEHIRSLNPIIILKYLFYLIFQIYSAGFSTIKKIINKKVNVDIVELNTRLKDDLHIAILANSITLTPGTVTLDKQGKKLKVLWIDCTTKDPLKAGKIIKKDFEKILSGN